MSVYQCPFCSQNFEMDTPIPKPLLVCPVCGEELVKKKLIKPIQVLSLFAAFAFIAPLLMMVFSFFQDHKRIKPSQALLSIGSFEEPTKELLTQSKTTNQGFLRTSLI